MFGHTTMKSPVSYEMEVILRTLAGGPFAPEGDTRDWEATARSGYIRRAGTGRFGRTKYQITLMGERMLARIPRQR
jgi:hypothetical protein